MSPLATGVDWSRIKDRLPKEIIWDQPINIFESSNLLISDEIQHSMSAKPSNESNVFRLVDRQHSWEAYFNHFHFSVSSKEENKHPDIHFGVDFVFKGHHPLARKLSRTNREGQQGRSVEIHGFSSFPEDTKIALKNAVNVALVDNSFIFSLSDECFQHMEAMKICWINSCSDMKFVVGGENPNAGVLRGLETLVLSNLASLKAFCAENVPSQCIESLKHMYIDCCPVLSKSISAFQLPENLETLQIKFCDELVSLCGGDIAECKLPKLHELSLLDLPKLKHIGADLPSLQTLTIWQCPEIELDVPNSILQLCSGVQLTRLSLDCCPQLKHVFSSSTAVFDPVGPSSSTLSPALPNLSYLQLWNFCVRGAFYFECQPELMDFAILVRQQSVCVEHFTALTYEVLLSDSLTSEFSSI